MRTINEYPSNPDLYVNVNKFRESFNIVHGSTKLRNLRNMVTLIVLKLVLLNDNESKQCVKGIYQPKISVLNAMYHKETITMVI